MIKEIFDIEPIQKNSLIVFLSVCCISFLQLFLFKREIIENNSFVTIGLILGLSISWVILQLPSLVLFAKFVIRDDVKNNDLLFDRIALTLGILLLVWMITLTYIAYELNLDFRSFIRISITFMIMKTLFWGIFVIIKNGKNATLKEK
ncbi:hypothetical protein [Flavobacterium franklandianum]|uniref:Uncharacterized protein n=1 Tax=Flavobacterium franklandianum TaxID=2594430 RepID=A0A553C5L8_9FLAO|nr:hypothetical protein [Flavobacterium franklandianum]TRX15826.1 hypothetical protein FNW17_16170 [Flavobacterium franklandianum]TRX15827.1 hypothetical protein FNW17_16175 [Flavobacterium franklandianum]